MANTFVDLVKIIVTSTGTGSFTLGSAVYGYRGVEALENGKTYGYSIQQDAEYEYGRGTYFSATNTLTRTVSGSSSGGAAITLRQNAQIAFVALAEDMDAAAIVADMEIYRDEAQSAAEAADLSASAAAISESAANDSAIAAAASAVAAAAVYDQFDDRYLGPKASDPTTDNDGNPLVAGALYYSTTLSAMRVYNGATWQTVTGDTGMYLPLSGGTMTGKLITKATATGGAGLNLPAGTAPTSPANGDVWQTTSGMFARINGTTYKLSTLTGAETLSNKTLAAPVSTGAIDDTGSVRGSVSELASGTVDCSAANCFTKTISANITFSFTNVPTSRSYGVTLVLSYSSGTVTWPASVVWPNASAPSFAAGKTYLVMLHTVNGGATWRAVASGAYAS